MEYFIRNLFGGGVIKKKGYIRICLIIFVLFVSVLGFLKFINSIVINYFAYSGYLFMPPILLGISYILPQKELYEGMFEAEFLIFCMHYPVIQILDALTGNFIVTSNNVQLFFKWLAIVLTTLIVIHSLHYILKRYAKPVFDFLYGKY